MDVESLAVMREAMTEPDAEEFAGIWAEHIPVIEAFLAVCLQWRVVPHSAGGAISMAGGIVAPIVPLFIGLDYAAVRAGLDAEGITVTPELWRGLRAMEDAAASALNEAM
jgi:hypothetical protein